MDDLLKIVVVITLLFVDVSIIVLWIVAASDSLTLT